MATRVMPTLEEIGQEIERCRENRKFSVQRESGGLLGLCDKHTLIIVRSIWPEFAKVRALMGAEGQCEYREIVS